MDVTGISMGSTAASYVGDGAAIPLKVMDMEKSLVENIMDTLLESLNGLISGLGENIDMLV